MTHESIRRPAFSLALVAMLLAVTSPVGSQSIDHGEKVLGLDLSEAPKLELGAVGAPQSEAEPVQLVLLAEPSPLELVEAFAASTEAVEAAAQEQATPKRSGFGRWLKKHWYVPVIVGVALGVALSSDDDDPNDLEGD